MNSLALQEGYRRNVERRAQVYAEPTRPENAQKNA